MINLNLTKEEHEVLKTLLYKEYYNTLNNKTMLEWARKLKLKELANLCKKINEL